MANRQFGLNKVDKNNKSFEKDHENHRKLTDLIASEMKKSRSIGDAIRRGMNKLLVNYRNAISNWALLGDPSLPVQ